MRKIKAIETRYRGYRFRSRLEARWAVFFSCLGLKWEYEPEGFDIDGVFYLPDFRVEYPGRGEGERHHEWFEVKGDIKAISIEECEKLVRFGRHDRITLLDGVPAPTMYPSIQFERGAVRVEGRPVDAKKLKQYLSKLADVVQEDRSGWALWSHKGRMWWDFHKNFFPAHDRLIEGACQEARGARFEHDYHGALV